MVSREGEEAEYHESISNSSTPPRMGSFKKSFHDKLQPRSSSESYQMTNNANGQILGNFHQLTSEANRLFKESTNHPVKIDMNVEPNKESLEKRLPHASLGFENNNGAVELKDLENESDNIVEMYEQNKCDVSTTNSSDSGAKSRRSCWVSNENYVTPNFDLNSATTTVKTPKKVNFQSLDEELKPHNIEERFKNGNYKGAKGFDVDPPPSYIDYGNNSQDKGGGGNGDRKGRDIRKWNFLSSDESSSIKESEDFDEKKVEIKSVPFLHLFRFASWTDMLLIFIGITGAICGGISLPFMIVLFGTLAKTFVTNDFNETQICDAKYFPQCCSDNGTLFLSDEQNCQYILSNVTGMNNESNTDFFDSITRFGMGTGIIGFVVFAMSYIFVTCLNHAAENQAYKIRQVFLTSVLRQNIGWYDTHQTSDFAAKMADDLNKFQEGIGEKIGMCVFFMTIFSANIVNAFYHGWQLTLVMMAPMPVLIVSMSIIAKSQTLLTEKEFAAYGRAGAIAEEVLSSIRTVVAFGGQKKEVERFEKKLTYARRAGIMRGVLVAIGGAIMWFIIYASYALAFWYGVKLIMDGREMCLLSLKTCLEGIHDNGGNVETQTCGTCQDGFSPASLMVVFFSVLMGAMNIGQASPYVEAFAIARAAAAAIFAVIDRVPEIDSFSEEGAVPYDIAKSNDINSELEKKSNNNNSDVKELENNNDPDKRSEEWNNSGDIIFDDVFFTYPSRPDVKILQGLNLTINKGETVALVGPSGCGKSTVIQLVQRFYDPENGNIKLGGKDIKEVNLRWLRERIGIVGQEPVLFGCTIAENIKQGRKGVTQEEMEKACIEANAYDFIKKLPKKFDTLVGERGAQLSGGQKQRIAIARALVRNPDILLLDEATSALDTQSESVVQAALDKARSGRTTIVVAHRLSTIRTADKIVAIKDGQVVETGSHEELMDRKGLYYSLVLAQTSQEFDSLDNPEYEDKNVEDGNANGETLDQVIDLSLPPLSSMVSSSTVLSVPAMSSSTMVNNFVNAGNNTGQSASITQLTSPRRKSSNESQRKLSNENRRKHVLERKISVASIMSDDSTIIEEASRSLGSAVGFSRVGSTGRESRRRSTLHVPRRQSVVSRRSSVGIDDRHLSTVTTSNNVDMILKAEDLPKINTFRIFSTNAKEWHYILFGSLASVVMGASMPVYAFLFGEMLGLLAESVETARNDSYFYSLMFLLLGVSVAIGFFFQITMYATAGEHLTQRMRKLTFEAMLRQEMGWFDDPANSTGALCSRLSGDAGALQGATGARGGAIVQAIFTIVLAISAGIYHEWRLGLVGALFVPVVLVGSTAQAKIISSQDNLEKDALETSAKLAIEAITNIRTVAGLGREKTFVKRYVAALKGPHQDAMKKSHLRGLVFGFAQSTPFFAYAGCMYYGGYLVETDGLPFKKCFQVAEALILGTMMVGQASAFQPNYNKAVIAAGRIFKLLDRKPQIDSESGNDAPGLRLDTVDGDISFRNARFQYPTRPEVNVLRELNLSLTKGQKVALVGPSGCGKSTCIQLLQRFYDLKGGDACLDNHNINSLNVPWLRSTMGIVSQEPVLFDRTLAENIQYGDNTREVSMDDVVDAARRANIHSFIASLPQGYQTRVGEKGTQLSGGQKQRVAIARALIRNPSILLLDEATSALDSESEKVVQDALDAAQEGRTSITIAHRLSTVINSDVIFVISHGRVVEKGTHSQLLTNNGLYNKLWSTQTGGSKLSKTPSFKVTQAEEY